MSLSRKIPSSAVPLVCVKVKEYKDKRVVTIQRIEKRRLFPGYVFGRMGLEIEEMMALIDGLRGAVRYVGSRFKPVPIEGPEMKLIMRKVGTVGDPECCRSRCGRTEDRGRLLGWRSGGDCGRTICRLYR